MQPTLRSRATDNTIYTVLLIYFVDFHVNLLIKIAEWKRDVPSLVDHSHRENTGVRVCVAHEVVFIVAYSTSLDIAIDIDNGMRTIFTEDLQ